MRESQEKKEILNKNSIFLTVFFALLFGLFLSEINIKDLELLKKYQPSEASILYDIKGKPFAELYIQKFESIPLERIPPSVVQTFVIVEDDNFYNHIGFDIAGILRASFKNLISGRIVQGGSTLTQQVSKLLYLHHFKVRKKTFFQKFNEFLYALKLEQYLSKEEILELYLNMVYFGHGCEGIKCITQFYFNKQVEDLTLEEAALLSRLPKSPVKYSPFKYPENAKNQHKFVLSRLVKKNLLEKEEAENMHNRFWNHYWGYFITTSPASNIRTKRLDLAPYFTNYIETILKKNPFLEKEILYSGGLKIYTTLDLDLQLISQEEMEKTLIEADKVGRNYALSEGKLGVNVSLFSLHNLFSSILPIGNPKITGPTLLQLFKISLESELLDSLELLTLLQPLEKENIALEELRKGTLDFSHNLQVEGALLAIDQNTGGIRAMIGGREFSSKNQFNRALFARRQPGSAFKIFVYGAGLENRIINSMSPLSDTPTQNISDDGSVWSPGNYDGEYYGLVPASLAFAYSINTCAVDLYYKVSPSLIIPFAQKLMKIPNPKRFRAEPTLALGSSEITPKELAVATAIIANEGKDVIPYTIRYIYDKQGNLIYSQEEIVKYNQLQKFLRAENQVLSKGTAFILRKMMEDAVNKGTLREGIRNNNFMGDLAGKTGTTSSWSDAWVTAFNPEMTFTLWFGFDKSSITLGPGQAGGSVAAPTLGKILVRYYKKTGKTPPKFSQEKPEEVISFECGYTLKSDIINGSLKQSPYEHICGIQNLIQDQRKLIMEELGIKPEDLGIQNKRKIKFRD
ncbi:MAG: transglycosylase domain-containing protein [Leptonema sp. (in: bacteria)]